MNDGSSVVLFTFILNLIRTGEWDDATGSLTQVLTELPVTGNVTGSWAGTWWLEFLRIIAQMLFLGPLFGKLMGSLVCTLLRYVYNDTAVEVRRLVDREAPAENLNGAPPNGATRRSPPVEPPDGAPPNESALLCD